MNGMTHVDAPPAKSQPLRTPQPKDFEPTARVMMMTPDMARKMLKRNFSNRKLRAYHVNRIRVLILGGRWRFNGETIKVDHEGNLLDGQHRLQAIAEAGVPCRLILVTGVDRDAFATIDTVRLSRSFGDVIQLKQGTSTKYSGMIGTSIAWLCRYDRGVLSKMHLPENKIENMEVEEKFENCPKIVEAVERAMAVKSVISPAMIGFVYYVLAYRANQVELADRMIDTLNDCSRATTDDPFFQLRKWLLGDKKASRSHPINTFAVIFKACNAASRGQRVHVLLWKTQGARAEQFPILEADKTRT